MEKLNAGDISSQSDRDCQPEPEKADMKLRNIAFMIDHMITVIALIAGFIVILLIESYINPTLAGLMWLVFILLFFSCYCLKDVLQGASLGKRMMGLAVRNRSNPLEVPSVFQLFIRNIFTIILLPVDFLFLMCSAEKRKLGDKIAGTDVYRISKNLNVSFMAIPAISIIAIVVFSAFFLPALLFQNDDSYQAAVSYIEMTPEIMDYVGDVKGYRVSSNGSLTHSEGYGNAVYHIKVTGSRNTMRIHITLEKKPEKDWEIISCKY